MKILHLSDLHFGNKHFFRQSANGDGSTFSLSESILECLTKNNISIDFLIISGDIFDIDIKEEIHIAKRQINQLFESLEIDKSNVIVVPGNHDMDWNLDNGDKYYYFNELLDNLNFDVPVFPLIKNVDSNLSIISLDSCIYEDRKYAGLGRVGETQLQELVKLASDDEDFKKSKLKIAVLHHHLLPVINESLIINSESEKHKESLSTTLDSVNVLRQLSELGIQFIISGHQHTNSIVKYENVLENRMPIVVSTVGSAGLKNGEELTERSFNVYSLNNDNFEIIPFKQFTDPKYFTNAEPLRIPYQNMRISEQVQDSGICNVFFRYQQINSRFQTQQLSHDYSNLFIILLNVQDCENSRKIIEETLENIPVKHQLSAMYDLLGKWDLMVFIRLDEDTSFKKTFTIPIHDALIENKMMAKGDDLEFSDMEVIDVNREAGNFQKILEKGKVTYLNRKLGSTKDYEDHRIQKGIIFIKTAEKGKIKPLIEKLDKVVKENNYEEFIESIYQSNNPSSIIIEFFAKCSEYLLINKFNRDIEKSLTELGLQKNTLLYYSYHENLSNMVIDQ